MEQYRLSGKLQQDNNNTSFQLSVFFPTSPRLFSRHLRGEIKRRKMWGYMFVQMALANWLLSPAAPDDILLRQEAVKELSEKDELKKMN